MSDIGYIMNVDNSIFNVIDIDDEPDKDMKINVFITNSFVNPEFVPEKKNAPPKLTNIADFIKKICPLNSGFAIYYKKLGGGKSGAGVYLINYLDLKSNPPLFKPCIFKIWHARPAFFNEVTNTDNSEDISELYMNTTNNDNDLFFLRALKEIEACVLLDKKYGNPNLISQNPITPKPYTYGYMNNNPFYNEKTDGIETEKNSSAIGTTKTVDGKFYPYIITEYIQSDDFNKYIEWVRGIVEQFYPKKTEHVKYTALKHLIEMATLAKIADVMNNINMAFQLGTYPDSKPKYIGCHMDLHPGNIMFINKEKTIEDIQNILINNNNDYRALIGPDIKIIDFDLAITGNKLLNKHLICSRKYLGWLQRNLGIGNTIKATAQLRLDAKKKSVFTFLDKNMSSNADLNAWGNLYIGFFNEAPHCTDFRDCYDAIFQKYMQAYEMFIVCIDGKAPTINNTQPLVPPILTDQLTMSNALGAIRNLPRAAYEITRGMYNARQQSLDEVKKEAKTLEGIKFNVTKPSTIESLRGKSSTTLDKLRAERNKQNLTDLTEQEAELQHELINTQDIISVGGRRTRRSKRRQFRQTRRNFGRMKY